MAAIYLMAFTSYYLQYQGLYAASGITPIRNSFDEKLGPDWSRDFARWRESGVLAHFASSLQLDIDIVMEGTCLCGIALSVLSFAGLHSALVYWVLYLLYLSLYKAGQVFLGFQWDIFLLETGVFTALYAPIVGWREQRPCAPVSWALRFLAFKFMFSSGAVKLQARDATWQNLTAMEYHFATTCLPTYEAWFFHNWPPWMLRLSTAIMFFTEIPATFLLIAPLTWVRRCSAMLQVALMVVIMLSGNYNWFNMHYALLMIPVWEQDDLSITTNKKTSDVDQQTPSPRSFVPHSWQAWPVAQVAGTVAFTTWAWLHMFQVELRDWRPSSWFTDPLALVVRMKYSVDDVQHLVRTEVRDWIIPLYLVAMVVVSLAYIQRHSGLQAAQALLVSAAATWLVGVSSVPFVSSLDRGSPLREPYWVWAWAIPSYEATQSYQVAASYGLFRSMTGVGVASKEAQDTTKWGWGGLHPTIVSTPVVVLEGYDGHGWHEIHFRYKPGDVAVAPRRTAPHQPRLDWQMWFAALGSYQNNPWLISFVHRLLTGTPAVINLLDPERYPFKEAPPQAIRADLYYYDFTRLNTSWARRMPEVELVESWKEGNYWRRSRVGSYLPAVQPNNQLDSILEQVNMVPHAAHNDPCDVRRTRAYSKKQLKKKARQSDTARHTGWWTRWFHSGARKDFLRHDLLDDAALAFCHAVQRARKMASPLQNTNGLNFQSLQFDVHILVIGALLCAGMGLRFAVHTVGSLVFQILSRTVPWIYRKSKSYGAKSD
ncbi:hypothetical protein CYMTET_50838 [Cymbomonas tetramitiformis]|uniref:Lipase maturation factor 2 n=1 Tax=Cymbomonas tetramitiformis TaxID=36881 RepID=A0AAE0BM91_9CHLO|nr:hypothetical protein CYMTET_50838 [Cymbomonas tetramitiformis]